GAKCGCPRACATATASPPVESAALAPTRPSLAGEGFAAIAVASRRNMRGGRRTTERAQNLRRELTNAERTLWYALRYGQLGCRFRRQFPIPPYIVDFACLEAQLVVECDGGQHAEPGEHDRRDAVL